MVLLMAVPMCWCSVLKAGTNNPAGECLSCHKFLLPEDLPANQPLHHSDMPCCAGTLERNLSPDIAAAPRLVLVDLQTWVWLRVEDMLPPHRWELRSGHTGPLQNVGPPGLAAPLYHQHCALLI